MAIIIDLEVQQPYFDAIMSGTKTIEGRLAKERYLKLKEGNLVHITNSSDTMSMEKTIKAVRYYASFEAAFEKLDYRKAIPNAKNVNDAISVYEQFYPAAVQEKFGVVFIELH